MIKQEIIDSIVWDQIESQKSIVRQLMYEAKNTRGTSRVDAFAALAYAQIGLAALLQSAYSAPEPAEAPDE